MATSGQSTNDPWFFGLLREAGGYRIVAAGPSEGRLRRELDPYTTPTLIATLEDLPSLNVGEVEWRRWLPGAAAGGQPTSERQRGQAAR